MIFEFKNHINKKKEYLIVIKKWKFYIARLIVIFYNI